MCNCRFVLDKIIFSILNRRIKTYVMTPGASKHGVVESEDQLEKLMKHTGCLELHYKVQECIAETKDWRKCQAEVQNFRKCMETFKAKQAAS